MGASAQLAKAPLFLETTPSIHRVTGWLHRVPQNPSAGPRCDNKGGCLSQGGQLAFFQIACEIDPEAVKILCALKMFNVYFYIAFSQQCYRIFSGNLACLC